MSKPLAAYKLCIFGDGGVGKTTMTQRYLTRVFQENIKMTIGADFSVKHIDVDGKKIALRIWDFGGEEKFRVLLPSFAKGANGGLFMYDITRYASIKKLDEWLSLFKRGAEDPESQIPILMVGGKFDLQENRSVPTEEAIEIAKSHNLKGYIECSSKTGENVDIIFETITREMMKEAGLV